MIARQTQRQRRKLRNPEGGIYKKGEKERGAPWPAFTLIGNAVPESYAAWFKSLL